MTIEKLDKKSLITLFTGMAANILEWYDFAVYGYLAPIIADLFFPSDDPMVSLISTFGVFAAGFFMRPLGGFVFGHIGDKYGRKKALALSIFLMAIPTALIGLLPTYAQIGVWAAVLLTIFRLLQGLSVGGAYTTSVSFLVEHAPEDKRAFYGSFSIFGAIVGILLGSAVAAVVTGMLDNDSLYSWGWRAVFIIGIVLGIFGVFISKKVEETPTFKKLEEAEEIERFPLFKALKEDPSDFFKAIGLSTFQAAAFYILFVYLTTYESKVFKEFLNVDFPFSTALTINTISMIVLVAFIPFMARLSDKIGRKPVILASTLLVIILSYPLFILITKATVISVLTAQVIFAIITSAFMGTLPTTLVELFPAKIRNSAYSVSYNIALALFGGTAPLIATYLIKTTGNILSPSFYLIATALVAFICGLLIRETFKEKI